jgi:hypothetical protein
MNRDLWVGLAGAALLVGAMTGVFAYERAQFKDYEVRWNESEPVVLAGQAGRLQRGNVAGHHFTINATDALVARVLVEATWTENTDDKFRIDIAAPDWAQGASEAAHGRVRHEAWATAQPNSTRVPDRTEAGAVGQARAALPVEEGRGSGNWTVLVTLVDGARAPSFPSLPGSSTPVENSYRIGFTYTVWQPWVGP